MQARVATPRINVEAYLLACVLSLTIAFCGPENVYVREREMHRSYIVSISSTIQRQDYMALCSLRACHCPHAGFNFVPLSTSATQLLPTAIYYRQIERFQGVSQFVLAPDVQAGYLHPFSWFLCMARATYAFARGIVIVTKSSENKVWSKKKKKKKFHLFQAKREDGSRPISWPPSELSGGI